MDWKPESKGIVAVSCVQKNDLGNSCAPNKLVPSVVLIWDFVDPIHPQVKNTKITLR